MSKTIFKTGGTPVAIYPAYQGVKGLLSVKLNTSGSSADGTRLPVAVLAVNGGRAANVQMTANLNNEAYYTLFGDRMTQTSVMCADLPGVCGSNSGDVKRLHDVVQAMNHAIDSGVLPSVKIVYASAGSNKTVTIRGYLVDIPFASEQQYRGTFTLLIQGYTR